jgi:hypothetical protein
MSKIFKGGLNFTTGNCKPIERRKSGKIITPEKNIQAAFIAWRDLHKRKHTILKAIFAVPNGIWTFKAVAVAMVKQGLTAGIQDVICLAPSFDNKYMALLIEFKTEIGKQSDNQLFYHDFFESLGYRTEVCRDWQSGARLVCEHLNLNIPY